MKLVERYLQAVGFWLPRQEQDDILAELSADIDAQIDERQSTLGHALSEAEMEDLLKQRGNPLLVANRFLPQQHLIGPVFFPVYKFVLKIFALGYLLPALLVWIGLMMLSPAYRAEHTHISWFAAMESLFSHLWFTCCLVVTPLTVAFAVIERNQASLHLFDRWRPRMLPPAPNPNLIPRVGSTVELAVNLLMFAVLAHCAHSSEIYFGPTLHISLRPEWLWYIWSNLLLAFANAALAVAKLIHPRWTINKAVLCLLFDTAGATLFCWLMKANVLAGIVVPNLPTQKSIQITNAINHWMTTMFPYGIFVAVAIAAAGVYRIVRVTTQEPSSE